MINCCVPFPPKGPQLWSYFPQIKISCKLEQLSMIRETWMSNWHTHRVLAYMQVECTREIENHGVCILFRCACFSEILPLKTFLWFKFPVSPCLFVLKFIFAWSRNQTWYTISPFLWIKFYRKQRQIVQIYIFIACEWWIFLVIKILWNKFPFK